MLSHSDITVCARARHGRGDARDHRGRDGAHAHHGRGDGLFYIVIGKTRLKKTSPQKL